MVKENSEFEYLKTSLLSKEDLQKRIDKEKKKSLLSSLFIIHGYMEAVLVDWFNYCGKGKPKEISDEIQKSIERIGFITFIQLHLSMGNISQELYAKMKKFNTARNDLAHGIRDINFESKKTQKGLERNINGGIKIYSELFDSYQEILDKQSKKFLTDSSGKPFVLGKSKLG